jgi:hypothetical protein
MDPVLVDPTSTQRRPPVATFSLAPRRARDLKGATVGLLANTKFNSDTLLNAIGELLRERHGVERLVAAQKPYFGRPLPEEMAADLAARCDAVITAIGD